jgi:hypothetical protein
MKFTLRMPGTESEVLTSGTCVASTFVVDEEAADSSEEGGFVTLVSDELASMVVFCVGSGCDGLLVSFELFDIAEYNTAITIMIPM